MAVANTDEGYEGEILPLQINIGDTVISSLRENDQLDWTFTGKKDAVEGVKSGKILCRDRNSEKFQSGYDEPVFGGDDTFRYYILYQ